MSRRVLSRKWRVVEAGERVVCYHTKLEQRSEDRSIWTDDGQEVLGSSEWMRVDKGVLEHIVTLHNLTTP